MGHTKTRPEMDEGEGTSRDDMDATKHLMDRGRVVAERLPQAAETARTVLDQGSNQMEDLSDQGVVAAMGLTTGVAVGLLLAGAPRPILALALLPAAITVRSAMRRGVRASALLTAGPRRRPLD
jgi:hypothetical protein